MLKHQIAVTLIPGIGDIVGKKLVAYCGGPEAVFSQKKQQLRKIPGIGEKLISSITSNQLLDRAEAEMHFIERFNIKPLFYLDKGYPERLKHCPDSPIMLYYKGTADLNTEKIISIVGTRHATEYGKEICEKIINGLSNSNALIISGLAYGIDTCAHKNAIKFGLETVGVLAHGLDRIYPSLNRPMAEKMIHQGGLLTDFLSKTKPDRENFPKRNRIIAGISDATVIIESGNQGGALITADIANSYSRDVFAIPGRIGDKYSDGCNQLVKTNKAALVQSAGDIIYMMGWEDTTKATGKQKKLFYNPTAAEQVIIDILKERGTSSIDLLCQKAGMTINKVAPILLNLEFQEVIRSLPGKMYRLDL